MTMCRVTEEPDEVKVSRPVLKTSGFREELAEFTIIGSAVLEDVKQILNTSDDEVAIESIYRLGFNPQNAAWCKVKIEKLRSGDA